MAIDESPIDFVADELEAQEAKIIFFERDVFDIHPQNDDLMVITIQWDEWEIKTVLIDQESSSDILYWDAFERLLQYLEDLKPSKGCRWVT